MADSLASIPTIKSIYGKRGDTIMDIYVNGKTRPIEENTTVEQLIRQLGLADERIAVEHNRSILAATQFSNVVLRTGDSLEIVRFVGGG
jgi:thiamine biosynthesis protein ThiS